jgi:hypothetical protein
MYNNQKENFMKNNKQKRSFWQKLQAAKRLFSKDEASQYSGCDCTSQMNGCCSSQEINNQSDIEAIISGQADVDNKSMGQESIQENAWGKCCQPRPQI